VYVHKSTLHKYTTVYKSMLSPDQKTWLMESEAIEFNFAFLISSVNKNDSVCLRKSVILRSIILMKTGDEVDTQQRKKV